MKKKIIDVEFETNHIINEIKKYFAENADENTKAVIGISGGKDSTITAMLCAIALGKDKVFGVLMPEGEQKDIADSYQVCNVLGIPYQVINIGESCKSLYKELGEGYNLPIVTTNTPARLRMATLYAIAGMINGRVINTCNYSESYVGYETKYGDGAGDFSILGNYCVREVLEIGEYVREKYFPELSCYFISKTPSDGMCGKTDEDNLGFTYSELDAYILDGTLPNDTNVIRKIYRLHKASAHKRATIRIPSICVESRHIEGEDWRSPEWF